MKKLICFFISMTVAFHLCVPVFGTNTELPDAVEDGENMERPGAAVYSEENGIAESVDGMARAAGITENSILLEEAFDFAEEEIGTDIGGWNGWTTSCGDLNQYTLDSVHSLAVEDGTENGVGSFYRSASNNNSAAFMSKKDLLASVSGGTISIKMRINRANAAAKIFLLRFYDSANHMMGFNIDLANSRIYTENAGTFPNFYFPGIHTNTPSPVGAWQELEWIFDFENGKFGCLYSVNGAEQTAIAQGYSIVSANNGGISRIEIGTQRNANGSGAQFYVDDICVRVAQAPITDLEACEKASAVFEELFAEPVAFHIDLPATGLYKTTIDWKSSDENVITSQGRITQLYKQEQTATLQAVFARGETTLKKEFVVTVPGLLEYLEPTDEMMQSIADGFGFSAISDESEHAVYHDLKLMKEYYALSASAIGGVSVAWKSSDSAVLEENGTVHRQDRTAAVTLTAEFTALRDSGFQSEKQFALTILPDGELCFYESFDEPESTEGQDIDGWNGWKTSYGDENVYVMDSIFTVASEEGTANKVASFFRPTCNANSMYVVTNKSLDEAVDGGTVNLRFRINRKNSAAKVFLLQVTDDSSHTMEFVVDLGASRIYSGGMNTPAFPTFRFPGLTANTPSPQNEWQILEFVLKLDEQLFDCYYGDTKIAENLPMISGNNGTLSRITLGTNRTANTGGNALFYVDDITMVQTAAKIADEEACNAVADAMAAEYAGSVITGDTELAYVGKYKTKIIWHTPDTEFARIRKNVLTATRGENDEPIVLTVRVFRNQTVAEREIPVTIQAASEQISPTQELVEGIAAHIDFSMLSEENPMRITKPLLLMKEYFIGDAAAIGGVNVVWNSDKPFVVDENGTVVQYPYDTPVTLTATITAKQNTALSAQKEFHIVVVSEGNVIFQEDFEDAPPENMNNTIAYNGWSLSRGDETHIAAMNACIEFDDGEAGNRILHVTRTVKNGSSPPYAAYQLVQKEFDEEIKSGVLAFSLRFKVTNSTSRVSMIIHDAYGTSAGTSIQISQYYAGGKKLAEPLAFNRWYTATVIVHLRTSGSHDYDLFIDHKKVFADGFNAKNNYPLTAFSIYSERNSDGPNASWFVDDIAVRYMEMDYETEVDKAYDALEIDETGLADGKLALSDSGLFGTGIKWYSSDETAISESGTVFRSSEAKDVTLTAVISRGGAKRIKEFTVTVPADTGIGKGFTLSDFIIDGQAVSGVNVVKTGDAVNCRLVFLQYERGNLKAVRLLPILPEAVGQIAFAPVDLSEGAYSECRAYIWDIEKNAIVSNVLYR